MQELLTSLNDPQRGAVETVSGPVMIIAGAGSGKTRVITYRTAYLIKEAGAPPKHILALTFTNRAAGEMRERVEHLLGEGATRGLWIGTFHSNFARLLRMHAAEIGYTNEFSIYDSEDSQKVIKEAMKELNISTDQFTPNSMQSRISMAKNKFILPEQYARNVSDYAEEKTAIVYRRYTERLRRNNAMDFDDLLIKPIELFQSKQNVLEFYQNRFEYLMIDEYQDTNKAQYIVAKLLAEKHRNICVVGDDAQSIYSWRGAEISNILSFQQDYPEAKVFRLEENYRSTKNILKISNAVIKKNKEQLEKTLFTNNPAGEAITLIDAQSEKQEAEKVSMAIRNMKLTQGRMNKDFAIFYRTNAQSRALEDSLKFQGIAYQIFGGVSFYKRREVKDVVAYLRFLLNEQDEDSLLRIINVPARGVGETTIEKLRMLAATEGVPFYDVVRQIVRYDFPPRVVSSLNDFR
ncbi:MAG: UvrD-helicase domain-containing protein, partial [Rhizobacter sp.]|nr:UvrD-helicase domain-containing protein [Chlorobiales bacterium]